MYISQTSWNRPKTRGNSLKRFILFIVMALFTLGWHSDFVPSENWLFIGTTISIMFTILITVEWWIKIRSGELPASFDVNESKFKTNFYVYVGIPAGLLFFIWIALTHGLASGINILFGSPYETTQTLVKKYETVKFGCDYHLRGDYLKTAVPDYLCIKRVL